MKINAFSLESRKKTPEILEIAKADLNKDGLPEFITRGAGCIQRGLCRYEILAETESGISSLGMFEGVNVLLGNAFNHGIRNLLVFSSAANDFDYDLYTWHPEVSAYRRPGR